MDIFALSSDTEQMPLSILEAMASSLPVVSFAVGDVPDMVSPENKMAASVCLHDDEEFIKCLLEFVDKPALRKSVGDRNCLVVKERFDANQMAQAYARLFDLCQQRCG